MNGSPTSKEVARLAGVSQPTVSRALRNLPGTSPATRDRVAAAAQQLGYVASDRGRALATRRSRRVAVVTEELTNPFYPQLVEPIRRGLRGLGYTSALVTAPDGIDLQVAELADGSYDGVVLLTTKRHSSLPRELTERGVPHVLCNRILDRPESPACAVDNRGGTRAVADLLARLGHVEVSAVHGPTDTSTGQERAEGLRIGLRAHGLNLRRDRVVRGPFSHEAGRRAGRALMAMEGRPTAIVCGNDVLAMGVLSAARELGLSVPDELTVVGFDDIDMASWPLVDLTTVRCDLGEVARLTIELLADGMNESDSLAGRSAPRTVRVPSSLVMRGTHGAPP